MLAKHRTNRSFDVISLRSTGQYSFARNYSKPGVLLAITHKKDLEALIRKIFSMHNMVESIFAQ